MEDPVEKPYLNLKMHLVSVPPTGMSDKSLQDSTVQRGQIPFFLMPHAALLSVALYGVFTWLSKQKWMCSQMTFRGLISISAMSGYISF